MKQVRVVFHVAILGMAALLFICNDGCAQSVRFDVLYSFTNNPANPYGTLIQGLDGNFYGTTVTGGWGYGTVFEVTTNGLITTLHSFTGVDGANPQSGLVQGSDGNFYGTTQGGGSNSFGTVFKVTTNGLLTTLYSFTGGSGGAYPYAALTSGSDGTLYGTTYGGGNSSSAGSVFKVTTNGFVTNLYSFSGGVIGISFFPSPDEGYPTAALTLGPDGNLYGTTTGSSFTQETENSGTIYKITTNGVLTTLYWFSSQFDPSGDGSVPFAGLTLGPDGNFYGTTAAGSTNGFGTMFKVTPQGALTTLIAFNPATGGGSRGKLTLGNDDNFYGTSASAGNGYGTIFKVTANGRLTILTDLYSFVGGVDGAYPAAGLTPDGRGNFYGTTAGGSPNFYGSFFKVSSNGVFTAISSFIGGVHGANPQSGLIQGPDGNFYGTTESGGTNNAGTIFKVSTNGSLSTMVLFDGANGAHPYGDLAFGNDGEMYGTAYDGGAYQEGALFKVGTNGMYTPLVAFDNGNGQNPYAGLTLGTDGNFYGTTEQGGPGTAFKLATNDVLTTIHFFGFNVDGALPDGKLALGPDGAFYGTAFWGGSYGNFGTVFRMLTNGTVTSLYSFTGGADGGNPRAGLTWGNNGNFYGTTEGGGNNALGTVFAITTNGSFSTLYSFTGGADGSGPFAGLTLGSDGNLYGATSRGSGNYGTLFQITTNGVMRTLVSFNGTNGANPKGALMLGSDGNFYGTTVSGGNGGGGVIFRLVVGGTLGITLSNGTPQISVSGQAGNRYAIDYTDSLMPGNNWVSITTNTISTNSKPYLDASASGMSNRFYRLRLLP